MLFQRGVSYQRTVRQFAEPVR